MQEVLDRAAVVPAALNAVLYAFQPRAATADVDYQALCVSLFQQADSPVLLDAVFDAVALVTHMVRTARTYSQRMSSQPANTVTTCKPV